MSDPSFQYPRTDRIPCNNNVAGARIWPSRLSVSSNGSNSLQLRGWPVVCATFFLSVSSNGSNSLQLEPSQIAGVIKFSFSILERIEFPATFLSRNTPYFASKPFSILERIEFPATEWVNELSRQRINFQYPRTDRIPCNLASPPGCGRPTGLSVSSNGSNSLQPPD